MALTAKKVYAILKRQISDMEAKLNSPVRYRGTVATADLLPLNPDIGDMYNIESKSIYGEAGMNVAWNGVVWDTMGAPIDMSLYLTKEGADTTIQNMVNEYLEKNPVKPGATAEQAQQIEQNKTNIASLKEDMSNKITKFYASNQGETHLADSDNGKIMNMMMYGRSEQKSTTGAQLFNMNTAFAGWVGDDGTPRNDGAIGKADNIVSDYIPVEGNTEYSCNNNNNNNIFVWEYDSSKVLIKSHGQLNSESFTTSETAKYVVFAVSYSSAQTPDYIKTVMFNKGSSILSWEPYTGGILSPNPDYPQEIKSVVNPTVKVYGGNFYPDGDLIELTKAYVTDFIPVILNKGKICISFDAFSDTSDGEYLIGVEYFDANKKKIGANGKANAVGNNISHVSFKFDGLKVEGSNEALNLKNVLYVKITFGIYGTTATQITYKNIMVSTTNSDFEPYKPVQTITLPYTLNAIPVSSGGNVTIDGQQYIADYVDVERGKLVRCIGILNRENFSSINASGDFGRIYAELPVLNTANPVSCNILRGTDYEGRAKTYVIYPESGQSKFCCAFKTSKSGGSVTSENIENILKGITLQYILNTPEEIDLTPDEIAAFKALATYYPTTNISVNSEQLDGYTVFNYPISMKNGWDYVKKQLNDNRDYIYDMDLQSAEAYVNSEYAVALTELEV